MQTSHPFVWVRREGLDRSRYEETAQDLCATRRWMNCVTFHRLEYVLRRPPPFMCQSQPEVWLTLDDQRVLARLRAAGPSWMHVFIDGSPPVRSRIAFTVVLRGADGGVVDGLAELMSSALRDGRTVLHLRLVHLSTSGRHELLRRFVRDVLQVRPDEQVRGAMSPLCFADDQAVRAIHDLRRAVVVPGDVTLPSEVTRLSKRGLWRCGTATYPAEIVGSSQSGRRLIVRRSGPAPSAWETVRLEVDLGIGGEPRPIQLVGMVIGTIGSGDSQRNDIIVRLARWTANSDRATWTRWLRHQQRLEVTPSTSERQQATRTMSPCGPPT